MPFGAILIAGHHTSTASEPTRPVTLIPAALPVTVRPTRKPVGELRSWPCAQVTGEPGLLTTRPRNGFGWYLARDLPMSSARRCSLDHGSASRPALSRLVARPQARGGLRLPRTGDLPGMLILHAKRRQACTAWDLPRKLPARALLRMLFLRRAIRICSVECDRDVFMDAAESCRSWATYRYQTVRAAKSSGAGPAWESEVARGLSHCFLRARSKLLTYI